MRPLTISLLLASALVQSAVEVEGRSRLAASVTSVPVGVIPEGTLSHFCVVTGWDTYNQTLATYSTFLGQPVPSQSIAGGPGTNSSYCVGGQCSPLLGTTKIAFMQLNNQTKMEFLAGEPNLPSWWRDVYLEKGYEIHHMGYVLPTGTPIWTVVENFQAAGLGTYVQWGRWGTIDTAGAGCYVYMDSQTTLGVTVEILANENDCDDLPAPPTA